MLHDFRFALRQLFKARGFTAAAVIVLALGIGANTAIFSLLSTMLFQPPAYAKAEEIVQIFSQDKKNPKTFRGFSYPTYLDVREQNSIFSGVMAHNGAMIGIGANGKTRRTFASVVSSNYFSVLGVMPMQAHVFTCGGEAGSERSLSHRQLRLLAEAGDESRAPRSHSHDQQSGVHHRWHHAERIHRHDADFAPEVWLPLGVYDQVMNDFGTENRNGLGDRAGTQLLLIVRLKPGITATAAEPALKVLAANLEQAYPVEQKDQTFMTTPLSRFATSTSPSGDGEVKKIAPLLSAWPLSSCSSRV